MKAPLIVVSGTGTGVGKTHVSGAILVAWARALSGRGVKSPMVSGLKPVETGVLPDAAPPDGSSLAALSTFHVKHSPAPYLLVRPVSPHLAARDEGRTIETSVIVSYVSRVRDVTHGVLVELAGGLFSPLAKDLSNAEVALALRPMQLLLVAPDRLGVLHEIAATTRAADGMGLVICGIVLVAPEAPDASTGTNENEIGIVTRIPVRAALPRGTVETLALRADLAAVIDALVIA